MKRTIIAITMLLLALFGAQAQLPQLTPVKDMKEELHPAFKNGKWGYANNKEKFVITPVFDAAEEFLRVGAADGSVLDVAKIKVGTAWGYLSREGTYFIEPEYFSITEFNMHSVAFALKAGTYTMYGVEPVYNTRFGKYLVKAVVLEKGFNAVPQFSFKGYAVARKDELYGFIDKNGKWLIPNEYDSISRDKDFDMYRLERNGRIGYATYDGNIVFPAEFKSIGWFGPGLVVADDGKAGLFRADGREILPAEFDSIDLFGENVLLGKGGKFGLASMKGKFLIPAEYDAIEQLPNGNFLVKGADGYNVYGTGGAALFPTSFDSVTLDARLGYLVVKDGLHGRLDAYGKYMYPCLFDSVPDPEQKGYVELMVDDEPYIFLAGSKEPRSVADYDDALYRQMSDRSYAASTLLPAWLKGHMGRGRIENVVRLPEGSELEEALEPPVLVCYTFHSWAGVNKVAVCPNEGRQYTEVEAGSVVGLVSFTPRYDPDEEVVIVGHTISESATGQYSTYEMKIHEAAPNGIALYEIIGTTHYWKLNKGSVKEVRKDEPVAVAYGFIGLGCEYFVQPIFMEASGFEGDTASVRIGEEIRSLTRSEIDAMDPFILPL